MRQRTVYRGTAATPRSVAAGRGLQFVQNAKSVVLVAQPASRQASVDINRTPENNDKSDKSVRETSDKGDHSVTHHSVTDAVDGHRDNNIDDVQNRVSACAKQSTNYREADGSDNTVRHDAGGSEVERARVRCETDNKTSPESTTDSVDELSRVRANLRSNNPRLSSTSYRFTSSKQTSRH